MLKPRNEDVMREIRLTQGKVVIVDDEDYEWLSKYTWSARKGFSTFYAARGISRKGKKTTIWLHREILGLSLLDGNIVDHINRNGLDCRKSNLRIVHKSLNRYNSKMRIDNRSGYRGVNWNSQRQKWQARIQKETERKHLGLFLTSISAAEAYDKAAIKLYGLDAMLNFPRRETI